MLSGTAPPLYLCAESSAATSCQYDGTYKEVSHVWRMKCANHLVLYLYAGPIAPNLTLGVMVVVFSASLNNISVISWLSVL
jgi:hypothetical protein